MESLLTNFGVEELVLLPNMPDNEFGAMIRDDLLEGVALPDRLNDDLLERLVNEFFLDFVVFKVVLKAEGKCEGACCAADGTLDG